MLLQTFYPRRKREERTRRESERESRDQLAITRLSRQRGIADGSKSRRRSAARKTGVSARCNRTVRTTTRALWGGGSRIVQVRAVENIEELCANLQRHPLTKAERAA